MSLLCISEQLNKLNVGKEWSKATFYKTIKIHSRGNKAINLTGNDRTKASIKHGVYMWSTDTDILYVGKAENCSIAQRTNSHLTSYRTQSNIKKTRESSSKKLKTYITENGKAVIVNIYYLDMTHLDRALISAFEAKLISHYKPILNKEHYGN